MPRVKKEEEGSSPVPEEAKRPVQKDRRVDLLDAVELLHRHVTAALCRALFKEVRTAEREREWTLHALVRFWVAMIVKEPQSLREGVEETRKRGPGRDKSWPQVAAKVQAFFERCQALRPDFFRAVFEAFIEQILPEAPKAYASWMGPLRKHFPEVLVVDGSRLDAVARRIKILWAERSVVLPGCVTAYYDLFRGIPRRVFFYADAAKAELIRAQESLAWIPRGALLVGDRLYSSSTKFFLLLAELGIFWVFRLNGKLTVKRLKVLSRHEGRWGFVEDALVEVGSGQNGIPKQEIRRIRVRRKGLHRDILTSVLDPEKLSLEQILHLYRLRWTVERMFLEIKSTLHLHALFASHPNPVAMQVYATALVHAAFRVGQAKIAAKSKVIPEQISPAKLFPKLARASAGAADSQIFMIQVRRENSGVAIKEPSWKGLYFAHTRLGAIVVEPRRGRRKKRRFCASRRRWKSFAHVNGGTKLLRLATVG